MTSIDLFHCSDLHFGHPAVPEQYEAIEMLIQERRYEVVAVSGDLTQRARAGEFQRARAFIKHAERVSKMIVVPGNHDVAWWLSPLGLGNDKALLRKYRRYISEDIEPVLRIPGATFVGLDTCHGIVRHTITWNLRDLSIIGYLREDQLQRAAVAFANSPPGDARVIVMHHNPVKGELSQRHGLANTGRVLGAFAELGVDLVLCGHDHQEAVHYIEHTKKGTIISTAGTISNRARGGRPSSVNSIAITDKTIDVHTLIWSAEARTFIPGPQRCFNR
ncbi:MAG TPA: metallophosphoesterase [Gemmatimonadaceae bacterium]|nr:metallophosphoesterase [Gemmatimonadaceae bacterium]